MQSTMLFLLAGWCELTKKANQIEPDLDQAGEEQDSANLTAKLKSILSPSILWKNVISLSIWIFEKNH